MCDKQSAGAILDEPVVSEVQCEGVHMHVNTGVLKKNQAIPQHDVKKPKKTNVLPARSTPP
jgi:hypothetical protein